MLNYYFRHVWTIVIILCLFLRLFLEREAEPGRYGDPGIKAHSSSAKKTVQDGEFVQHHFHQGGEGFIGTGRQQSL